MSEIAKPGYEQHEENASGFRRHHFLAEILACPACQSPIELDQAANVIRCLRCEKVYPIVDAVPIMLEEDRRKEVELQLAADHDSQRMVRVFTQKQGTLERVYRALQPPRQPYFGTRKEAKIAHLIDLSPNAGPALEIGSGSTRTDWRLINMDISPFPKVDVVGGGTRLPFLDCTLSVVASQAVLEHIPNPWKVAGEMFRVLKPGGYVYAEVPGVVPYHGFPAHYQNFTKEGLEKLFYQFKPVEAGVVFGPSTALAWMLKEYAGLFFSNFYARAAVHLLVEWLVHPLNYLDIFLHKIPNAHRMAMTLYFIGRKDT